MPKLNGGESCPQCGQDLPSNEPICLRELDIVAGKLNKITDSEDEDFSLATIENILLEVSRALSGQLFEMIGTRIWLAMVKGQIRVGEISTRPLSSSY
jgi:hypothetical protein